MKPMRLARAVLSGRSAAGDLFVGLVCYSLVIAPFGCQLTSDPGNDPGASPFDPTVAAGMFINDDRDSDVLVGGRSAAGDEFFVYGERSADGGIGEIDAILILAADGRQSFITFESGRPVHVRGPDGSYADIRYEAVGLDRLAGEVVLFDAATGASSSYQVEIDPRKTAAEVAALVQSATGRAVETVSAADAGTEKSHSDKSNPLNAQTITIISPLFALVVLPLVAAIALTTAILGQILVAIYTVIAVTLRAVLLAAFAPLFIIGAIFGDAVAHIEVLALDLAFIRIPLAPVVVIS
jgi:hypothetical protein